MYSIEENFLIMIISKKNGFRELLLVKFQKTKSYFSKKKCSLIFFVRYCTFIHLIIKKLESQITAMILWTIESTNVLDNNDS